MARAAAITPKRRSVLKRITTALSKETREEKKKKNQIAYDVADDTGWNAVIAAFLCMCIQDGIIYTFGEIHTNMVETMNFDGASVSLIHSVMVCLYMICGPLAAAFINKFGFRACVMLGSVISSLSLYTSCYAHNYIVLLLTYGVMTGVGFSFIYLSNSIILQFYHLKCKKMVLSVVYCGSSIGISVFFPLNNYLVKLDGWRSATMLHSAFVGLIFFIGMVYEPLMPLVITQISKGTTAGKVKLKKKEHKMKPFVADINYTWPAVIIKKSPSERTRDSRAIFIAPSIKFPTIKSGKVKFKKKESNMKPFVADKKLTWPVVIIKKIPSERTRDSRARFIAPSIHSPTIATDMRNDDTVFLLFSSNLIQSMKNPKPGMRFHRKSCTVANIPSFRDYAFYEQYNGSWPVNQSTKEEPPGITIVNYHISVFKRKPPPEMLPERISIRAHLHNIFGVDLNLMRRLSFVLICFSGFLLHLGRFVPYVHLATRNIKAGLDPRQCHFMMSVMGISNTCGKIAFGLMSSIINPWYLYIFSHISAGLATIFSNVLFTLHYQYMYSCAYGFFVAGQVCLRNSVMKQVYGLDRLTHATGMLLFCSGFGSLLGTPMASEIMKFIGDSSAFYVAGGFITVSGLVLVPIGPMIVKEEKSLAAEVQ